MSAEEMSGNTDAEFFYVDVPVVASEAGSAYYAAANEIVSVTDANVLRVYNPYPISGGLDRETNIQLLNRVKDSIGARDLNTGSGFRATMLENFLSQIVTLQPIGFLDPEMMRDIVYNFHIGGRIDGWVKTPEILDKYFDALTINLDFSRIIYTSAYLQMADLNAISLGKQSIDETARLLQAYNTEVQETAAQFIGYADLTKGVDLSAGRMLVIGTETFGTREVNVSGVTPAKTQPIEIVNAINHKFGTTVAIYANNPAIVNTKLTGGIGPLNRLIDPAEGVFFNVQVGDDIGIIRGANRGSYKVLTKISNNELELDVPALAAGTDISYKITRPGIFIKIQSSQPGRQSSVTIGDGISGASALTKVFGLATAPNPYEYYGGGRYAYVRDTHYSVNVPRGTVSRIVPGREVVSTQTTGFINPGIYFEDNTLYVFFDVRAGDVLTVYSPSIIAKDYRILEVDISYNKIRIDAYIPLAYTNVQYAVTRTGIKNMDYVLYEFGYNPLSIDVGGLIQLDDYGRVLGVRPGREAYTITDTAFLYIKSIEVIDAATKASTGEVLDGTGGYGQGGYGRGPYGIGSRAQYYLRANKPELRFSALEDSLILIDSAYINENLRVAYAHVQEINAMHDFVTDDGNRILDADILMKHFIPAVVSMTVKYSLGVSTSTQDVTPDTIKKSIVDFINGRHAINPLDASDIIDIILYNIDNSRTRNVAVVTPFEMVAVIHNTDGSTSVSKSTSSLKIPSDTIPKYTTAPLSPRTAHWIAGDIIVEKV